MDREEAEKHWQYTEEIILKMLALAKYLYVEAMIHGAKHERKAGSLPEQTNKE